VCSDVKAMIDSSTGTPLWTSCVTVPAASGGSSNTDGDVRVGWRTTVILFIVFTTVGVVAFAIYTRHKRQATGPKPMTLTNVQFNNKAPTGEKSV
jgi:hypothetical protein